MSIWTRIADALSSLAKGEGLSTVFEKLRTPPERSVAFAIAVIGLGAKMAKADGLVTRDEVSAFREVFFIAPDDEANAAKVFNLARQDVAGFEEYARRIKAMYADEVDPLCDLMEGLFHIAMADGNIIRRKTPSFSRSPVSSASTSAALPASAPSSFPMPSAIPMMFLAWPMMRRWRRCALRGGPACVRPTQIR